VQSADALCRKSLVSSFGEALAEELRGTGLRVLVTEPGSIRTDFSRTSGSTSGHAPTICPVCLCVRRVVVVMMMMMIVIVNVPCRRGRSPEIVAQEAVDALAGDHAPRLVQGSFLELLTSYLLPPSPCPPAPPGLTFTRRDRSFPA
jgi:short-subunit dehydrogenase